MGKNIRVLHYPPGTSTWNKIEPRLFVCISKNRQGIPLTRVAVVVALINATTTAAGLTVTCVIDESKYKTGIKITDEEIDKLNSIKADFHGEGNYSVAAYT